VTPHGLVTELHPVQKIKFPGIRRHHEDLSVVVLEVDLAIPAGGRSLDLGLAPINWAIMNAMS